MPISLRRLMELGDEPQEQQPAAYTPIVNPQSQQGKEFNVGLDFTAFERTIASFTENAKNTFQQKLMSMVGGKRVYLRASKGYGQPIKDYTINVKNVSIDFYYERYVVVFKDEDDKEYFLEPGYKIKILGPVQIVPKAEKKKKKEQPPVVPPVAGRQPTAPAVPAAPVQPTVNPR